MTINLNITADEAHKLHETDLYAWLIALRDHPLEALCHIPPTILNFIRKMKYIDADNVLTDAGAECLSSTP